jgi:hypothetical protein
VRLALRIIFALWISGNLLAAFAQGTTVRSGFAITTLVSGNIAGLVATESLINTTASGVEHAIIAPSALITTASMLVPVGPLGGNTTAIAIANPSSGTGAVNLVLTDNLGAVVLNTAIPLGPFAQFSKFLDELFSGEPGAFSTPLLLIVSSEIPISILALNFRTADFASIPLISLSAPSPVPVIPQIQALTSTIPTAANGFGLGVAPTPSPQPVTPPMTTSTAGSQTTPTIGGSGALVFAQIARGGGWSTEIAIGNTSSAPQIVRVDFFSQNGATAGSLTDIVIPPQGVFFFSTDSLGGTL